MVDHHVPSVPIFRAWKATFLWDKAYHFEVPLVYLKVPRPSRNLAALCSRVLALSDELQEVARCPDSDAWWCGAPDAVKTGSHGKCRG